MTSEASPIMPMNKTRMDLLFYLVAGFIVYSAQLLLYVIDYAGRDAHAGFDYAFLLILFGINMWLVIKCRALENWARNAFVVKFVLLAFFFYPNTWILKAGSWMYSPHFPLGVFQRMANFGEFFFELFFTLYLVKRSVRLEFTHR